MKKTVGVGNPLFNHQSPRLDFMKKKRGKTFSVPYYAWYLQAAFMVY